MGNVKDCSQHPKYIHTGDRFFGRSRGKSIRFTPFVQQSWLSIKRLEETLNFIRYGENWLNILIKLAKQDSVFLLTIHISDLGNL